MKWIKYIFFLCFLTVLSLLFISKAKAENQVVVSGSGEKQLEQSGAGNKLEQSGTGTRFETGSVTPMWGGTGEYTFQTYFVDPQGREPEFVKIYISKSDLGKEDFHSNLMTKGQVTGNGTSYIFKKTISEKDAGNIFQFYFEAKIGDKLIHGPSYWGEDCTPGGCGKCCGVWGGPKILSAKLLKDNKIYLFEQGKNKPVVTHDVGENWITSVSISPDERYLAAADNQQNLYLFDIALKELKWKYTGQPVMDTGNLGMDKGIVAFSHNGYLAASLKGVMFLFKVDNNNPIWSSPTGAVLNGMAISKDGQYIVAGGRDTYVYLWQKDSSTPVWKHKIEAKGGMMGGSVIRSLSMTADGKYFVVGTSCPDRSIHVFTPQSSEPVFKTKVGINFPVESVSITDDARYILAGGGGSSEDPFSAVLFKLNKSKPIWNFDVSVNPVNEVAISSDGIWCVTGSIMEGILTAKCESKDPIWRVNNTGYIGSLSFSADGEYLAAGTGTNHVLLISTSQEKIINDWQTVGKAETSMVSVSGRYVGAGTGLNRFFMISTGGETNTSGAGGTEIENQKPEIVTGATLTSQKSTTAKMSLWENIKDWYKKIINLIFK